MWFGISDGLVGVKTLPQEEGAYYHLEGIVRS